MTLDELIRRVNEAYPDDLIEQYHRDPKGEHGDGLARFIAAEVRETFEPDSSDEYQLATAAQHLESAMNELAGVVEALA